MAARDIQPNHKGGTTLRRAPLEVFFFLYFSHTCIFLPLVFSFMSRCPESLCLQPGTSVVTGDFFVSAHNWRAGGSAQASCTGWRS